MKKILLFLLLVVLSGCVTQCTTEPPSVLFPVKPDKGIIPTGGETLGILGEGGVDGVVTHTPTTRTVCNDGMCTTSLYAGTAFAKENGDWKPVEDVVSLINSTIVCSVIKDSITDLNISCVDYNLTSVTIRFDEDIKLSDLKKLPYWTANKHNKSFKADVSKIMNTYDPLTRTVIVPFNFSETLHIGENSTTIELQDNNTENYADAYVSSDSPTLNFEEGPLALQDGEPTYTDRITYFNWNISQIPNNRLVTKVYFKLQNYGTLRDGTFFYMAFPDSPAWAESTLTWNNQPCPSLSGCAYVEDTVVYSNSDVNAWLGGAPQTITEARVINNSDLITYIMYGGQSTVNTQFESAETGDPASRKPTLDVYYTDAGETWYSCNINGSVTSTSEWACHPGNSWTGTTGVETDYNTFDGCAADATAADDGNMWVEDVRYWGDNIIPGGNVTAQVIVKCFSAETYYAIYYHDGTSWSEQKTGTCAAAGVETFETVIDLSAYKGEHYIRGAEAYQANVSSDCFDQQYADVDDVLINLTAFTYPQWSQNSTNETGAGANVEMRLRWKIDDTANFTDGGAFTFGWHNGTNWTTNTAGTDQEAGEQKGQATPGASGLILFDTFENSFGNYTSDSSLDEVFKRDTDGTPSAATGPQPQNTASGSDGEYYLFVETSSAECFTAGEEAGFYQTDDFLFPGGANDYISYHLYEYGTDIGVTDVQQNTSGSYVDIATHTGAIGASWNSYNESLTGVTGRGSIRFLYTCKGGYLGDIAVDEIKIKIETGANINNSNLTAVQYNDVVTGGYVKIDRVNFTVEVSGYSNLGSVAEGDLLPELFLMVYNSTDFKDLGNFTVTGTGNKTFSTTDSTVLSGWGTAANRDLKLQVRYANYYNSTDLDNISWTGLEVIIESQQEMLNDSSVNYNTNDHCSITNQSDCWVNITKNVNDTAGATIKWRVWTTTSDSGTNSSDLFTFVTTGGAADACAYSSGDWTINCATCNGETETGVDVGGNDIILTGSGRVVISPAPSNFGKIRLRSSCNLRIR